MPSVGVVAIQGDFEKHLEALTKAGAGDAIEVRTPEELAVVERVILPGGESTTVGLLMRRYGLGEALQSFAASGKPIWGTCMGMILMAQRIKDRPDQWSLGLLDIEVERNAFGAQVHSFEDEVEVEGLGPALGVFIRAPIVTSLRERAQPFARYQGHVVGAIQDNLVGTSFHPELTDDVRLHDWFLRWRP